MSAQIRWCCIAFKNLFECSPEERGIRGVAVGTDPTAFFLVFRAIDAEHVPSIPSRPFPITIEACHSVRHCPDCGVNLEKHYGRQQALPRQAESPCGGTW